MNSETAAIPEAATPIIKYAGGKTKLLPELLARMPDRFGRYYEPFAGGAALFFRVALERAVLADSNPDLMWLYTYLAKDVAGVIRKLEYHRTAHSEAHYYATRTRWNDRELSWSSADRAATFIYLNKTCFNGLWRVNRKGEFNVAWGKHVAFSPNVDGLRAASDVLARADLRTGDYRDSMADAKAGDFAYFDPPYDATFGAYTAGGFTDVNQAELAHTVRCLVDRGVQVMVSNSDTPRIRALYAGMRAVVMQRAGTMNSDGKKRGAIDEVIVTGGYEVATRSAA